MVKKCLFVLVFAALAAPAFAQARLVDHWWTPEDCVGAVAAPLYRPTVVSHKALGRSEVIKGHPTGGCFEIALPKNEGSRGWVRIEAGRPFVYNEHTGKLLRLAECNNEVYGFMPFAAEKPAAAPRQEPSGVPEAVDRAAAKLSDAIAKAAARAEPQALPQPFRVKLEKDDAPPPTHSFLSLKRKSGQIFWGSVIGVGTSIGAYCAAKGCFNQETTVYLR